jgi:hypothetical protein
LPARSQVQDSPPVVVSGRLAQEPAAVVDVADRGRGVAVGLVLHPVEQVVLVS